MEAAKGNVVEPVSKVGAGNKVGPENQVGGHPINISIYIKREREYVAYCLFFFVMLLLLPSSSFTDMERGRELLKCQELCDSSLSHLERKCHDESASVQAIAIPTKGPIARAM